MIDQEKLQGRRVVASISGGKDSGAMSLYLHEHGISHDRVFLDTGWEHPLTYEYLRGPLTNKIGTIIELRAPQSMESLITKKGMFPSRRIRFCTQELKVLPMQSYLRARIDSGEDVINAVGIRANESAERSRMLEWEWQDGFDCEVWRPLLRWTEEDVISIHKRHGLTPNPLYLMGASRVGCWPCINARKSEIRLVADSDPDRIIRIRRLEEVVAEAALQRAERDGRHLHSMPTWFQSRQKEPIGWPIDRVVAWSRTIRGGTEEDRQERLFESLNDGCMRWGLCDTGGRQ